MTRKDYVLISKAIKDAVDQWGNIATPWEEHSDLRDGVRFVMENLIPALKVDNSAFDVARFRTACGF